MIENFFIDLMSSGGSHTLVNIGIFAVSILAIHYTLRSVMHVILAGIAGVGYLFMSNAFLGTAYATDFRTIVFFAAAGAATYLVFVLLKGVARLFRK